MLIKFLLFLYGTCLASFITLVTQRLELKQSPWRPARSYCDHCHQQLTWWQLIPIIGFIIQRGKCCFCHTQLSFFYPVIELISGLCLIQFCLPATYLSIMAGIILTSTLIFIAASDYFYQIIYPVSLSGLFSIPLLVPHQITTIDLIISGLLMFFLGLCWYFFHGIGEGDLEYLLCLLILLGWHSTTWIILASCLVTIVCFCLSTRSRLPFLPALTFFTAIIIAYLK